MYLAYTFFPRPWKHPFYALLLLFFLLAFLSTSIVADMFLSHCFWNSFWCSGYPALTDSPVQLVTAHAECTVYMLNFKFMSIKRPVSPQLHQLSTRHDNNTSCNPQQINHFIQVCNTMKDGTTAQLWQDFLIHEPPEYYQIYYAIDIIWGRSYRQYNFHW